MKFSRRLSKNFSHSKYSNSRSINQMTCRYTGQFLCTEEDILKHEEQMKETFAASPPSIRADIPSPSSSSEEVASPPSHSPSSPHSPNEESMNEFFVESKRTIGLEIFRNTQSFNSEYLKMNFPLAKEHLRPDSEEYYRCDYYQFTLHERHAPYEETLNHKGIELYSQILERLKKGEGKRVMNGYLSFKSSGGWEADQTSKYFKQDQQQLGKDTPVICLCGNNNYALLFLDEEGMKESSLVIMYGQDCDGKWAYTRSGSIYRY